MERATIGDTYLSSVESQSSEVNEQTLARVARQAWNVMKNDHAREADIASEIIAEEVTGGEKLLPAELRPLLVSSWGAQVAVADAALSALAAGVNGGPVAAVLAQVGIKSMFNQTIKLHHQAQMGLEFTTAIRDNASNAVQRAQAEAALSSATSVSTVGTQVGILRDFLISQG